MKIRQIGISVLLFASILFTACGKKEQESGAEISSRKENPSEETASHVSVTTLEGVTVDTSVLYAQSELTVIYIWDPSEKASEEDLTALELLNQEYAGRGIQILGVARCKEEDTSKVQAAKEVRKRTNTSYTQFFYSKELQESLGEEPASFPVTYFVTMDGKPEGEPLIGNQSKDTWTKVLSERHEEVCTGDHPADCNT